MSERQELADLAAEIAKREESAVEALTHAAKRQGVASRVIDKVLEEHQAKQPKLEERIKHSLKERIVEGRLQKEKEKKKLAADAPTGTGTGRPAVGRGDVGAAEEKRGALGTLVCGGEQVKSEVIYWRDVPGDSVFESPITPHHGEHHETYVTFQYDQGGWNNIRMGIEIMLVTAHAMGRTLVVPPVQNLYLLGKPSLDPVTGKRKNRALGFEDFFDLGRLKTHQGLHVMSMKEFLAKEAAHGQLTGKKQAPLPLPRNNTDLWGSELWSYLGEVADLKPQWSGKVLAMPAHSDHLNDKGDGGAGSGFDSPEVKSRLNKFAGPRTKVYYTKELQDAKLLHFPAGGGARLLQHHYAFNFFADPKLQSFYKRFIRDYMRYQDEIQCAGAELVRLVREDARQHNEALARKRRGEGFDSNSNHHHLANSHNASSDANAAPPSTTPYYALHVRRGDFQFKDVKISASEMIVNIRGSDGTNNMVIPRGSLVYISTDDPKGVCEGCYYKKKPCPKGDAAQGVPGCIADPSWDAFRKEAGWEIRFLGDYLSKGHLKHVNPNFHGMVESIVCSRADVFVGTWWSTFTGYIHRLRGYHGLGEQTYYHTTKRRDSARVKESIGHGFSREWRYGWTDDGGNLI